MGGLILIFILVLLVAILVTPLLRARLGGSGPAAPAPDQEPPHEVVVHKLDDHRKKTPGDDAQKPQG